MVSKCIYKVHAGKSIFRVLIRYNRENVPFYVVFNGRKYAELPFIYDDWMRAIGRANALAGKVLFDLNKEGLLV